MRPSRRTGSSRPGCLRSSDSASSAVRKSPAHELAGVVDEEAAVGVPVPGDPEVGALLAHLLDDEAPVLLQQRVGFVVGEVPVRCPVGLHQIEPEPAPGAARPSARPCRWRRPRRPSASCPALTASGSMNLSAAAWNSSGGPPARPSPARRRRVVAAAPPPSCIGFDLLADVLDALVPGQRERPLAHRASRPCRASGCARRCTSARRRASASRPGSRRISLPTIPASSTCTPSAIIPAR